MYNSDFPISFLKQYQLSDTINYQSDTFDIIYVLEGQLSISSEMSGILSYPQNNITILHSNSAYQLIPEENNIFIHLGLRADFMQKYACQDHQILCDSVLEPNRNYIQIKNLITSITTQYLDTSTDHQLSILGLIFQLLDLLKHDYAISAEEALPVDEKNAERVNKIKAYLNDNYRQQITLNSLAEALFLTPQYLSKYFKRHFNTNFNQYLNQIRIEHALRDLIYTKTSITDIAVKHGFPNISTFNRHFREFYGSSPREYRKNAKIAPPVTAEWLPENQEFSSAIYVENADTREITTHVGLKTAFNRNFSRMINIGFAKNLESEVMRDQIIAAKNDLNIQYIRLEGLISNAIIPRLSQNDSYYFTYAHMIISFLHSNQLIPFIELGKNSFDYINYSTGASVSRGYSNSPRFHDMFRAFLQYARGHFDPNWMRLWKFELWKMPKESDDNYFEGFQKVQDIISEYLPGVKLGGPGHITSLSSDELLRVLNEFVNRGITPGFISSHFFNLQYSMEKADSLDYSATARGFHMQQMWIKDAIYKVFGKEIPLYITEFNSSIVPQTYINGSCFQAAFICKNLLEMHEDSDLIGYWLLNDESFHEMEQQNFLSYGIGLINKNGISTPAYYAYRMLNQLGDYLIEKGENYCITYSEDGHYQILTYNYAHYKNLDALVNHMSHSIMDVYSYFEQIPPITMKFTLHGLPQGEYRVRRYLLDRMHGSVIDVHIGGIKASAISEDVFMYKMQTPGREDANYLKSSCIPEERTIFLDVDSNLSVTISLSAHNVCLFDIVREL